MKTVIIGDASVFVALQQVLGNCTQYREGENLGGAHLVIYAHAHSTLRDRSRCCSLEILEQIIGGSNEAPPMWTILGFLPATDYGPYAYLVEHANSIGQYCRLPISATGLIEVLKS